MDGILEEMWLDGGAFQDLIHSPWTLCPAIGLHYGPPFILGFAKLRIDVMPADHVIGSLAGVVGMLGTQPHGAICWIS